MTKQEQARANFERGCTCSQAVLLAFAEEVGLDEKTVMKLAGPFGGGMGRMREVCGAFSAMLPVLGARYGSERVLTQEEKGALYADVQALAARFREHGGSIVCRELLEKQLANTEPMPAERSPAYYQKRRCAQLCGFAAALLEDYIQKKERL